MAIVYHGTTFERARAIIQSGKIKCTSVETRRYESTRTGFVYVTKSLVDAMDFSSRPAIGQTSNIIIVFKIEIDESELQYDTDEINWNSTFSQNGYEECYRIARDLLILSDVVSVYVNNCKTSDLLGCFLQDVYSGAIVVDDQLWDSFHHEETIAQRRVKLSSKL